jgi:hypothetical protein
MVKMVGAGAKAEIFEKAGAGVVAAQKWTDSYRTDFHKHYVFSF